MTAEKNMDRSKSKSALDSLKRSTIKQQTIGKRKPPLIGSSNTALGDVRKFTKKELEEACRKQLGYESMSSSSTNMQGKRGNNHKWRISSIDTSEQDTGSQVKVLDAGVKACARKLNDCKAQGDRIEEELGSKMDALKELKKDEKALDEMINGSNPEARRIAKLNNDIEKVNEEAESKLNYRYFLYHMLQRLQKNSIALDSHMGAMADTMIAVEKEKQKCERMLGEVESGCTKVTREFEATTREVEVERAERSRALNSKKNEANNAERIEAWRHERESSRMQLEQSLGGANRREKEKRLRQLRELESNLEKLNAKMESKTGAFGILEEAFTHIKQATGANTLIEMVDKFTNHQEHRDRLLVEKKEAEERLNSAIHEMELAHQRFDQVKANGFGNTDLNREIINEINDNILKEKANGKVVKSTNMKLEGVLVGLRQGGMGLYQRLLAFHPTLLDGEAPKLSENATTSAIQAAHDTLEMLKVTEQILGKMLDAIGGVECVTNSVEKMNDKDQRSLPERQILGDSLANPSLGENNCRIKVKVTNDKNVKFHESTNKNSSKSFIFFFSILLLLIEGDFTKNI